MIFLYEYGKNGIRILRVFGEGGEVILPETIEGLPVTELADYVFSGRMEQRELEAAKMRGKYYNDSLSKPEELPEICGADVKEVYLPKHLKRIGRYAFYTCANLTRLAFYGGLTDIGAGAFTGCHKVDCLCVELEGSAKSCLRELLLELPEEKLVEYQKNGEEGHFWFPEFFEEGIEDTPARNTEVRVHGSGMYYRNCFHSKEFSIREYDDQFYFACTEEREELVTNLAMGRILYPMELSEKAAEIYQLYLKEHFVKMTELLVKKKDYRSLGILLKKIQPSADQIETVMQKSEYLKDAEWVSLLMDYRHEKVKPKRKVFDL